VVAKATRVLLALAFVLAAAGSAGAHSINFAVAFVAVSGPPGGAPGGVSVDVNLTITASDVERATRQQVNDPRTGTVDPGLLQDAEDAIARYVGERTWMTAGDAACTLAEPPSVTPESDTGISVALRFTCPAEGALVYRSRAMLGFDPAARQAVMLRVGNEDVQVALLDADDDAALLRSRLWLGVPVDVVGEYVRLGIEHIFLGYDHIAFLIAVLLWARRLMTLVKVVTAFTVAHSITLSLAALGIVVIPSWIVEPAIAATIVLVAAENFFSRNVENRWMWTGPLGLIHGFGFASALAERGLPPGSIGYSLAAFNIGVEIGQIAIVSIVLPLMLLADRALAQGAAPARRPALVYPMSAIVMLLGAWWFAERTVLG
jgi:hydrogenase/urease accessory protein HupE